MLFKAALVSEDDEDADVASFDSVYDVVELEVVSDYFVESSVVVDDEVSFFEALLVGASMVVDVSLFC